jgi:hypothetical protein
MKKTHQGSCHCGAVRFEADVDLAEGASKCNCSVCQKLGVLSAQGKPAQLRVLAGEATMGCYEWGGKIGQRYFCKTCGAHPFSRGDLPELGGAFMSINVNCLDDVDPSTVPVRYWDGRHNNWEAGTRTEPWPFQPQPV